MLANDYQRYNIWRTLTNQFSYIEFKTACELSNIEPLTPFEFAQKVGLLLCAAVLYPHLPDTDAYLLIIKEHQQGIIEMKEAERLSSTVTQTVGTAPSTNCRSCGGGTVR